jgi:TPR repeat protein
MRRPGDNLVSMGFLLAAALTQSALAQAALGPAQRVAPPRASVIHRVTESGVNIVRMPPRPVLNVPSTTPAAEEKPKPPSRPSEPEQLQGRLLKPPVTLGSQPNGTQNGFLGVEMEAVELPLALSLGLPKADGAFVLNMVPGAPAAQAGIRVGDIIVGLNGRAVSTVDDVRQRVASLAPGTEVTVEVWRAGHDSEDTVQVLRRLAEAGNAHVMYRLGRICSMGPAALRDEAEGVRWYRRAADAGNASGMTALATALLQGRGTPRDPQEALRLLKRAAATNSPDAMYQLASILLEGQLVEKDALEAARLFTRAAEAGHVASMFEIGRAYYNGTGVQADPSRAAMWYKQAADLGSSAAIANLGWLYEHGKGVEADLSKAISLYKRAVDLNQSSAMVNLALLYANGKGLQKNEVAAVALYWRAVALGNPMAMNNLAWMLQAGQGVARKDPKEAADLMLRALDKRNEFSYRQMTQNARAWSREFRQALQAKLRDLNFYSGPIDGELRDTSVAAINTYVHRKK